MKPSTPSEVTSRRLGSSSQHHHRTPSQYTSNINDALHDAYLQLTQPSRTAEVKREVKDSFPQSAGGCSQQQRSGLRLGASSESLMPQPPALQHDAARPRSVSAKSVTHPRSMSGRPGAMAIPEDQLAKRFEDLFASSKTSSHRMLRGAQYVRPSHAGRRPPAPRTEQERTRGREIELMNRHAVTTSSPTKLISRSPVRCKTAGGVAVSPPPPPVASLDKLKHVAVFVEHQRESGRRVVEEKMRRAEEIDKLELRKKIFPFHEEIEQLILRVCSWHVTLAVIHSSRAIGERVRSVRQFRREQVAMNERAWLVVSRSMYPPLRRWVRRIRMKRCMKIFFCIVFVVKLRRGRRLRGAVVIRYFLRVVAKDRSRALHRFQHTVRRAIYAVERSFRCRKALRIALDEQWMTMETTILLFQFHLLPDALLVPGWKDEVAPLRLKLQHLAPTLPPLEDDASWEDVPLYMIRVLKWRSLLHRHRPVGLYEDSINQLPRSLACFRVSEEARRDCIDEMLDAEYRYQRHKFLDARAAAIKKMRNLEEWKERQAAEIRHDVTQRYSSISPSSSLFGIICTYELEKRVKAGKVAQRMNFTTQAAPSPSRSGGGASSPRGNGGSSTTYRAASLRTRLLNEYELFEKVREALQQQIQGLIVKGQRRKSGIGSSTPPPGQSSIFPQVSLPDDGTLEGVGLGMRKATFRQPLVFAESSD
jgi:hypothetical protein